MINKNVSLVEVFMLVVVLLLLVIAVASMLFNVLETAPIGNFCTIPVI